MLLPLLAIETSTRAGAVALDCNGRCAVRSIPAEQRNASGLLPAIDELLASESLRMADVGAIAFSAGPGSFTGLRIAATVARTAQFAAGCRVVAVPTMDVIAAGAAPFAPPGATLAVMSDARRGEVFAAAFRMHGDGRIKPLGPVAIREPLSWLATLPPPVVAVGDAALRLHSELAACGVHVADPAAATPSVSTLVALARAAERAGQFSAAADIRPLYVRRPECEEVYEERRAAAIARRKK